MKILIEANVKNKKNLENTSGLILSLKDYSVQSSITYTLEEIKEIVKTNPTLEIFINLNKNFFNDEIENLKDLFILKYIDCEIGYETEWLFEQKLTLKANIVIPEYKDRIQALKTAKNKLFNLSNIKTQDNANNTYNNGEQVTKQVILPLNEESAEPNSVTTATPTINSDERSATRVEDLRPADLKIQIDEIERTRKFLMDKLLGEFKNLFMGVY